MNYFQIYINKDSNIYSWKGANLRKSKSDYQKWFADKTNYLCVKNDFDSPDLMIITRDEGCTR